MISGRTYFGLTVFIYVFFKSVFCSSKKQFFRVLRTHRLKSRGLLLLVRRYSINRNIFLDSQHICWKKKKKKNSPLKSQRYRICQISIYLRGFTLLIHWLQLLVVFFFSGFPCSLHEKKRRCCCPTYYKLTDIHSESFYCFQPML